MARAQSAAVASAASARLAQTSRQRNCESGSHAMSKPARSASATQRATSRALAQGGMRRPKRKEVHAIRPGRGGSTEADVGRELDSPRGAEDVDRTHRRRSHRRRGVGCRSGGLRGDALRVGARQMCAARELRRARRARLERARVRGQRRFRPVRPARSPGADGGAAAAPAPVACLRRRRSICNRIVRAAMLLRANTLAKGNSGARIETVELLLACLDRGVLPVVPSRGSVGASGDLAPLAHLALPLVGEGEAVVDGRALVRPRGAGARRAEPFGSRRRKASR